MRVRGTSRLLVLEKGVSEEDEELAVDDERSERSDCNKELTSAADTVAENAEAADRKVVGSEANSACNASASLFTAAVRDCASEKTGWYTEAGKYPAKMQKLSHNTKAVTGDSAAEREGGEMEVEVCDEEEEEEDEENEEDAGEDEEDEGEEEEDEGEEEEEAGEEEEDEGEMEDERGEEEAATRGSTAKQRPVRSRKQKMRTTAGNSSASPKARMSKWKDAMLGAQPRDAMRSTVSSISPSSKRRR